MSSASQTRTAIRTPGASGSLAEQLGLAGADGVVLVARVLIGVVFLTSGFGKLTGLEAFTASLARQGVPFTTIMAPVGAAVELFGGVALVLGVGTRYAALLMVLFVIVATLISHRFWELEGAVRATQRVQFMKNVAIDGGLLLLFVTGGGRLSLDGLLNGRR